MNDERAKKRGATEGPGRRGRRGGKGAFSLPPVGVLLAAACVASALVLAASDLMVTFEIVNPGGDTLEELEAGDRHGYVMLVIAFFALFCLALAVLEGSKPAAAAVAVSGGLALLLFLIIDLPDAGQVGTVDEPVFFANAETEPRAGFWFELIGALSLAVSGAALATLTPEQLRLRDRWRKGHDREGQPRSDADESASAERRRRELRASERSLARTQGGRRRERT
jgi:hypothetical protein